MIYQRAIDLLYSLISAPSLSREESETATILQKYLAENGITAKRHKNNVWALSANYDITKPTLLLNSHHDTVKPSPAYSRDPFVPFTEDGRIYGLGSNDAGASLIGLLHAFISHRSENHPYNLALALTAEEEVGGENGIRSLLPVLDREEITISMALVGEPTSLQPAIGERGLVVMDCVAKGKSGHAARNEGVNALYIAVDDICKLRNYQFPKISPVLGPIKISVTQIEAGRQHNVVPDECRFVVDVRTTDAYSNEETAEMLGRLIKSESKPRSTRVWPSVIADCHPLVQTAVAIGGVPFVSPTTSDMSLLHNIPSLKIGPGESSRSHTADEYIEIKELIAGIDYYDKFLYKLDDFII